MNRWGTASQFLSEPEPTPRPCLNKLALRHVVQVTLDLQHSILIPLLPQEELETRIQMAVGVSHLSGTQFSHQ